MIKLGDFGMKTLLEHSCMNKSKQAGMLYYTAPEVYNNTIEKKSDVWSLGITMIELAEGKNPFAGYPSKIVERVVCSGKIPSLSSPSPSSFLSFLLFSSFSFFFPFPFSFPVPFPPLFFFSPFSPSSSSSPLSLLPLYYPTLPYYISYSFFFFKKKK